MCCHIGLKTILIGLITHLIFITIGRYETITTTIFDWLWCLPAIGLLGGSTSGIGIHNYFIRNILGTLLSIVGLKAIKIDDILYLEILYKNLPKMSLFLTFFQLRDRRCHYYHGQHQQQQKTLWRLYLKEIYMVYIYREKYLGTTDNTYRFHCCTYA